MSAGDELVGVTLGAFRVDARIGSGATGVVFRATSLEDGRPAALKVLHDNLGSISGLERRFSREARVLAKLRHPNIVEVIGFGVEQGRTFLAMELLEGETLEDALARGPLPPARALAYFDPILAALAEAHDHEVVHRDLKPANVFLTRDGGVKVLDFGLSKMLSVDELSQEGTLTRKGRIVGTPAYMSPEQITGVFMDVRADVYALGIMLYELLADRRPFLYERRRELLRAHLLEPVPPITKARPGLEVDRALEALLARSLAKDPADRFPHARAMLDALRALPPNAARVGSVTRSEERRRPESSSTIITNEEREELARSVSGSATIVDAPAQPTRRGIPTGSLFVVAALLLAAAAALWIALMILPSR